MIHKGYYGLATNSLNKSLRFSPDNYRVFKKLGIAHFKIGQLTPMQEKAFSHFTQARDYYLKAYRLNPINSEISYGLARQEMVLEKLYRHMFPENKGNPYNALPHLKKAIQLWPNSVVYNYALARYFYYHKDRDEFLSVISTLFMVYPPAYKYLKNDSLWSPQARKAAKKGLGQAIKKGILIRDAHKSMSSILAEEGNWVGAISHFINILPVQHYKNISKDYIHLGHLYLKNKELTEAKEYFLKGLKVSIFMEKDLENLYNAYRNDGYTEELYHFLDTVRGSFIFSNKIEVLTAQSLIKLKRFNKAKSILMEVNQRKPISEAYYLLAKIARIEEDWDKAELAAQKATVLEATKSRYHLLFSQILKRLRKLERAEKEAGLAIRYSVKPYPWLFDNRAWIRWMQKKHLTAARDWEMAIKLSPKRASYYTRAAECYVILGNFPMAIDYYKKAGELDPENERYKKRYREIESYKTKNSDKTSGRFINRDYYLCRNH
ncbi:MAG: hypothetical protein U9R17_04110 [Thermodesulfobacteriota bacterium]|nr:hypothetical protein [Thermodesulfobacteriota bacterium]